MAVVNAAAVVAEDADAKGAGRRRDPALALVVAGDVEAASMSD